MKNCLYKVILSTILILQSLSVCVASTPRLRSSANIGVGSILLDEATILNPASSAFYKIGAIFYQKSKIEPSDGRSVGGIDSSTFIASDAKGRVAGSVSYRTTDQIKDSKNISVSLASIVGEQSATGVTYHYEDENEKYKYITFGITHAINEMFTLGFVLRDPLRAKENNSNANVGLQYTYKQFITLMGDFGTDWKDRFDEKLIYGGAVQFKIFDDLFIRGGLKIDKQQNLKTKGFGGSWSSPKFVVNLAMSFDENTVTEEEIKETTFSVSYKF